MPDMTALAPFEADVDPRRVPIDVEIVVPVYNEAAQLAERITGPAHLPRRIVPLPRPHHRGGQRQHRRHRQGGAATSPPPWRRGGHAPAPQGARLRPASGVVDQRRPVVAYMDVDLSTSLPALLPLVAPLLSRAIATSPSARGWPAGRTWCAAQARAHLAGVQLCSSSSPCGAGSAMPSAGSRHSVATRPAKLLPLVEDNEWFFDTELLVTAERLGLRIGEVPVDWVDDPDSRVQIVSTGEGRSARSVADVGPAPKGLASCPLQRGGGRPTPALRRRGCRLHARLPLPVHRLAAALRVLRCQCDRDGHCHALQHSGAP
jgi:hypothetical protein